MLEGSCIGSVFRLKGTGGASAFVLLLVWYVSVDVVEFTDAARFLLNWDPGEGVSRSRCFADEPIVLGGGLLAFVTGAVGGVTSNDFARSAADCTDTGLLG
jgi:hypothetical protein